MRGISGNTANQGKISINLHINIAFGGKEKDAVIRGKQLIGARLYMILLKMIARYLRDC